MKLVLQKRIKFIKNKKNDPDEYYYDYVQLEIETFRWLRNHEFEYVKVNGARWLKLDDYEEIVGLGL